MKTLEEMRARLVEIESELRAFKQKLEDESRNPTDDEKKDVRERLSEADELEELVELEKRRLDLEGKFAQPSDDDKKKLEAMKLMSKFIEKTIPQQVNNDHGGTININISKEVSEKYEAPSGPSTNSTG